MRKATDMLYIMILASVVIYVSQSFINSNIYDYDLGDFQIILAACLGFQPLLLQVVYD